MTISKQQMDAALARMPRELAAKTLNMEFKPHFLGKNKFAYRQERFDGEGRKTADWMLYDAKEGGQTVLAEGPKLAESLEAALGRPVDILTEEITILGLEETGFKFRLADGAVYTVHSGRLAKQKAALEAGDLDAFFAQVVASGKSSFCYLQNVYTTKNVSEQGLSLALCLAEQFLAGKDGAFRVHGGGFAGTVQAFVPHADVEGYRAMMDSVFGEGACLVLRVRPLGAISLL